MTAASTSDQAAQRTERDLVSELFHAISQPLTALECGLELSLRRDKTAAQLRARVKSALVAAKLLHQRLSEAKVLQDAAEPGDTSQAVALETLLLELREDFLPVAESAKVNLCLMCETATVRGNEARFRNGFFYLFEFLLRTCPSHRTVSIRARRASLTTLEISFRNCDLGGFEFPESMPSAAPPDLGWRVAQRTFQAAGGDLVLTQNQSGQFAGYVRLLLAN
ncbi:MAG TPA: hypothetical protein VII29_18535 [Terriglobales bacterium]